MATAIPKAYLASSAIRCRDVETGPNLGVLAVFPSTGATCRCPPSLHGVSWAQFPRFGGVGSEEAPRGAGLRPPLKRYVQFSRIPLSQGCPGQRDRRYHARSGERDHTRRRACAPGAYGSLGIATVCSDARGCAG